MTRIPDKVFDIIQTYDDTNDPKERLNIIMRCITLTEHELNQMLNEEIHKVSLLDVHQFDNDILTPEQAKIINRGKELNRETIELNKSYAKLIYENIEKVKETLAGFKEMKRRTERHISNLYE